MPALRTSAVSESLPVTVKFANGLAFTSTLNVAEAPSTFPALGVILMFAGPTDLAVTTPLSSTVTLELSDSYLYVVPAISVVV